MYVVGNGMYRTEQSNGAIRRAMRGDDTARSATATVPALLTHSVADHNRTSLFHSDC